MSPMDPWARPPCGVSPGASLRSVCRIISVAGCEVLNERQAQRGRHLGEAIEAHRRQGGLEARQVSVSAARRSTASVSVGEALGT